MVRLGVGVVQLLVALNLFSAPIWVTSYGADTSFDHDRYLTGYGVATNEGKNSDGLQTARDQALKNVAQKLKVGIDATSRLTDSQFGEKNYSNYQSDFKAMVAIDLGGVEKYESAFDANQNRWVALAVLNKEEMALELSTKRSELTAQLGSDLKELTDLSSRKRPDLVEKSLQTYDLHLDKLIENLAISRVLDNTQNPEEVLKPYYEAKDTFRSSIRSEKILNEGDLVTAITKAFPWNQYSKKRVALVPALYKTTDISGQFCSYLRDDLVTSLQVSFPELRVLTGNLDDHADAVLRGSYYEAGDGWHLVFKLTDLNKNAVAGTWETDLDSGFVKAQRFQFLPDNIKVAVEDHDRQVAVYANPVQTELRVWTNKGTDGMTFLRGEKVSFYIQVNRPGFVSILYHLAGVKRYRVPLIENYPIRPVDVYKPIKIEQEFEVAPPFGSESAQVFFSPDPIKPFETVMVKLEGQDYPILSQDYDSLIVKTRGLIKARTTTDASLLSTDSTLTITTIEKR